MKKIIYKLPIVVLLLIGFLSSCTDNESEYLFDGSVNQRFEKIKKETIDVLTKAEDGWIGYYSPNDKVGGFALLFKFDKNGNVAIKSDYNKGGNDNTITYRIDKTLKVELVFESHSVLHQIYETNRNGVNGEYVFNILDVKDDKVLLESTTDFGYGGSGITQLTLTKATKDQWDLTPVYENTPKIADGYNTDKFFRGLFVEGTDVKESFSYLAGYNNNVINRYATLKKLTKEGVKSTIAPLAITNKGFTFIKPYNVNGKDVQNFIYNEAKNEFVSKDGGQTTVVKYSDTPPVLYFPSANMGMDGKFSSQLFFKSFWFKGVTSNTSKEFLSAYDKSGLGRFYIDLNTDLEGKLSKKLPSVMYFKMGDRKYRLVAFNVKHVKNERIIFSLLSDLSKSFPKEEYRNLIKPIIDIFNSPEGFYVEPYKHSTPFGAYDGFIYISAKDTNYRFCTIKL